MTATERWIQSASPHDAGAIRSYLPPSGRICAAAREWRPGCLMTGALVHRSEGRRAARGGSGIQDWLLVKKNYAGRQSDRDLAPDRQDHLLDPVDQDEDRGAHGIFGDDAKERSIALWATTHRRALAAAGTARVVVGGAVRSRGT